MTRIRPHHWLRARASQAAGPLVARYGDQLRAGGQDLPAPRRVRIPTRTGSVRCEVYRPPAGSPATAPAVVHLHGGAFLMRYPRMDDWWCRELASALGAVVVNVDYDVAPQRRYPVAQHQAADVLGRVLEDPVGTLGGVLADGHGIDPGRVAVSGFSAGGNLAAAACLLLRDEGRRSPAFQLLAVPALDMVTEDKRSVAGRSMIDPALIRLVRSTYFVDAERRAEPYASPLLAPDLTGLPPALVVTAEYDALRAEGDAYAGRLRDAGVPVEHHVVPGRDHYFLDPEPHAFARTLGLLTGALGSALVG